MSDATHSIEVPSARLATQPVGTPGALLVFPPTSQTTASQDAKLPLRCYMASLPVWLSRLCHIF